MDGPMEGKEFVVPSIPTGLIRQAANGGGGTTSPLTTKGDLYGFSTVNARLPVGSNGQILVADSTQALGIKWANASGGGDMLAATYDPAGIAEQLVGLTASQTLTNKTLTAPAINSGTVGTKLSPTSDDGAPLGDTTHNFSDLFLASGAVINYANGNAAITHSSGILTVSTGDLRVTTAGTNAASVVTVGGAQTLTSKVLTAATITTSLVPTSDDGAALGDATHNFSDLFLASGAVINYANGNVVMTHTSGIITMGTGDFRVSTAGTNSASVVTVGGTQTLTNKTLTSPVLNSGTVGTSLVPTSNDGAALGSTSNQFSDLFLAEGGVINWDNGDATMTQTGNDITIAGITTFGVGTSTAVTLGTIELGAASDTTIARVSAGVVSIEGVNILTVAGGTLTGAITLGENTSIALDPAGSADGKYTGITIAATAGYTQSFGDVVYLDPTDSRWEKCDANSAAGADGDSRGTVGMVVSAGTDGNPCVILLQGVIRADAAFPTFTINNPVYISETAGAVTQTQPTTTDVVIRVIGFALTADEMFFSPSSDYITHT